MNDDRPLLMIPGPVELSPAVLESFATPPPGHLAPRVLEAFGASLEMMRRVWRAADSSRPFVVTGGGTVAMEMAVANLIESGDRVLVVNTGFFSDRLVEMLRRYGAEVSQVTADVGEAPRASRVESALRELREGGPVKALLATHVDTSTAVRIDPEPLARIAREHGALSIFDGVCSTAAERFDMSDWDVDVFLSASQKAIGLPPGLALLVASERALTARLKRRDPPPLVLDWERWRPVMEAYEDRRPAYFSTPATNLIVALEVGLREILAEGMAERFALHERAADALRAAWRILGLEPVPARPELASNALSALRFPDGVDGTLIGRILDHGVVVAGGLHPAIRGEYFRIGHMGYSVTRRDVLARTVRAVGSALRAQGVDVDTDAACARVDSLPISA